METDSTSPLQMLSVWAEMFQVMKNITEETKEYGKEVIESIESRNETVDVVIFTTRLAFLGTHVFQHFRSPLIGIPPSGRAQHIAKYLGNPENPSYQPENESPFVEPMTFLQRLSNTLLYSVLDYDLLGWLWMPLFMDSYFEKFDVSLLLLCSHFVTHSPQVLAANTIEVGGLHCRDSKKLPDDLQLFLDSHSEGVVYVSFGSTVKPSQMSDEKKQVFLDTFRQLNHPVIGK